MNSYCFFCGLVPVFAEFVLNGDKRWDSVHLCIGCALRQYKNSKKQNYKGGRYYKCAS